MVYHAKFRNKVMPHYNILLTLRIPAEGLYSIKVHIILFMYSPFINMTSDIDSLQSLN